MTRLIVSWHKLKPVVSISVICRHLGLGTSLGCKNSAVENSKSKIIGSVDVGLQIPPSDTKNDWVGPPHPVSNLRQTTFVELRNEGDAERQFREKRLRVQEWNQRFWEQHNEQFKKMKEEFVVQVKEKEQRVDPNRDKSSPIPPEEMSKFYKRFLDDTYKVHMQYNKAWYKKNIGLLAPAVNAFLHRIVRKLF